jgi:glycosyltransferase involved in cell wall biosynthesis
MSVGRPLRIFVPSAARLLTDRRGHGEGLIAWQLLTGLAARGHELVVCARTVDLTVEPPFELIVTGLASRFPSIEPLVYMRRVGRLCRARGGARRFDLAHWLFPTGPTDTLFAPPASLPLVVGPQSAGWPGASTARTRRIGDAVRVLADPAFRLARRRTERATSMFLGTTASALADSTAQRSRVVPRGVDLARFIGSEPRDQSRILFVGKLEQAKGVRDLVEAFPRVRASVPRAELVLAGEGPELSWIERRAKELGLNGSLQVLGPVPHGQVPELLDAASLLCLPSHGEPFGMAALEAMAAGRAVVGTNAGGLAVLVDPIRGGRLVRVGDTHALADALIELLTDRTKLAELGHWNREHVRRELSLERVLDGIEDVYSEVLS